MGHWLVVSGAARAKASRRPPRWSGLLVASSLLAAAACSFDARVPADTFIPCSAEAPECPGTLVCRTSLGFCFPKESADQLPPRLASVTVPPAPLKRGDTLEVVLVTSEPLGPRPTVRLLEALGQPALTLVSAEDTRFVLQHLVGPGDVEGLATVSVDLIDRSGNPALGLVAGAVTLDFTLPALRGVDFVAPRAGDGGVLDVRATDAVAVRVTFAEPVRAGARLLGRSAGCDAGFALAATSQRGSILDYTVAAPAGAPGCAYALVLEGAVDLSGNPTAPPELPLGATYRVASDGPIATALETRRPLDGGWVPATAFSRQPGHDVIGLGFELAPRTERFTAFFDGDVLGSCDLGACAARADGRSACFCARPVSPADLEGAHSLSVSASDPAGNTRSASTPLRLDFRPPALVPGTSRVLVSPAPSAVLAAVDALAPGGAVQVSASVDESCTARLTASPTALAFTLTSSSSSSFDFTATLGAGAALDGPQQVQLAVEDEAGNPAAFTLPVSYAVDSLAPPRPDTLSDGGIVYLRVPWGDAAAGPRFVVTGAPGSVPGGSTVLVTTLGASELARARATDAGAFSVSLAGATVARVGVVAVDGAANASPLAAVKNVEWVASLNGKVPGSLTENPHVLTTRPVFVRASRWPHDTEAVLPATAAAAPVWRETGAPTPRSSMAMAWDEQRQRSVVFAGELTLSGLLTNELWEWDGDVWTKRTDDTLALTPRFDAVAAYDSARGKVVVYGGETNVFTYPTGPWEWDGNAWFVPAVIDPSVAGLRAAGMAYDSARGVSVVFGGQTDSVFPLTDEPTMEWDGQRWTRHADADGGVRPSARGAHSMAFEASRGRSLVFGGETVLGKSRELWSWDGAAWSNLTTAGGPGVRYHQGLVYDSARDRTVLFGGYTGTAYSREVWEWDGSAWTNRTPAVGGPTARAYHAMAYDRARQRTVVFGGYSAATSYLNELWEWDGTGWTNRSPGPVIPPDRQYRAVTFDTSRGRLLAFGGDTAGAPNAELYEYDGTAWVNRTGSPGAPTPRTSATLAFDGDRGRAVLFGGWGGASFTNQLFEWDGATWFDRTPAVGGPAARGRHASAYDTVRKRTLVFGGTAGSADTNELWEWDGATWTNRTVSSSGPSSRRLAALAFDASRGVAVLFGGSVAGGSLSRELWEWDGTAWTDKTTFTTGPEASHSAAMTYDALRRRVIVQGGWNGSSRSSQTWEWDGSAWTDLTPAFGGPSARFGHSLAFDPLRGRTLLLGAAGAGLAADLWELRVARQDRSQVVWNVDFARAFEPVVPTLTSVKVTLVCGGDGASSAGAPLAGAALSVCDQRSTCTPRAAHAAPTAAPVALEWEETTTAGLARLMTDDHQVLSFTVSPVGVNAPDAGSTVTLTEARVVVRYRLP